VRTMKKQQKSARGELWIGLAKVEQSTRNGVLGDTEGAYTNAIAIADDRASFRSKVKEALGELDLRLIRLEDAETWKARSLKYSVDSELRKVAKEAKNTGRVGFGTFHAFEAK
jgi:hypothetical protein